MSYESRGREEKRRVGQAFLEYFVICGWTQMDLGLGLRSEFWGDDQIVWHKIRESCVYRSSSRARKVWSGNRCTVWREVLIVCISYIGGYGRHIRCFILKMPRNYVIVLKLSTASL